MHTAPTKHIEIVAGPNGSGKATFAEAYFKLYKGNSRFINADMIALGLAGRHTEQAAFHAGRVMLTAIKEALADNESFAFETTLSGKTWLPLLNNAVKNGYRVTIYFIYLKNPSLNLKRIRQRVKEGGHTIPKATVLRRYPRSFENFWNIYHATSDNWFLLDNSGKKPKQTQSKLQFDRLSKDEKSAFGKMFLKDSKTHEKK